MFPGDPVTDYDGDGFTELQVIVDTLTPTQVPKPSGGSTPTATAMATQP